MDIKLLISGLTPGTKEAYERLESTRDLINNSPYFNDASVFDEVEAELIKQGFLFEIIENAKHWYLN